MEWIQNIQRTRLSAYEVKNNSCLFERLFKVKKNGVFLFAISFFILEIHVFTFLYYANERSDDIIDRSTKTVQHSIKNISGKIKAVFLKLGTRNVHHKRNKRQLSCHCHDNSYAAGLVLIKTKIPRFHLTQGSFTPKNLMGISELRQGGNHVYSQEDPLSHSKRLQTGIFGLTQKETGTKGVAIATIWQVSFRFFCDVQLWCQV